MNAALEVVPTTLVGIEIELGSVAKRVEKDQWRIAELLYAAKGYFDNEKSFKKWVSDKTGYTVKTASSYIDTYDRFKDNKMVSGNQKSDKPIPISSLRPLAAQDVNHRTVEKVVRKLTGSNPPTKEEVHKMVRESKPTYIPPPVHRLPDFAVRAERKGKFTASHDYLFGIHEDTPAETISILAKHWKGKYHPDKGGDPEIFDRIVKAEQALLADRGE